MQYDVTLYDEQFLIAVGNRLRYEFCDCMPHYFNLFHPSMLRFISIFYVIALFAVAEAQTLLDAPQGLTVAKAPDITGTPLKKVESFSREDGLVSVTVLVYPPITLLNDAYAFVAGNIAGMKNNGFKSEKITKMQVRGFDCRKIEGLLTSESYEGSFNHTTLLIFSTDAVYGVSLSVHDSTRFDQSIEDLANRLKIAGSPMILQTGPPPPSAAYQAGEKFGQAFFYVIIGLAIFLVVKRIRSKKKA